MLKRIQEIKSIGCFYHDQPAAIQFEPLTFIFGENCYGKSTLCDVFRRLSDNNPEYITDRKTVPDPQNQNQAIRLNLSWGDGNGESPFVFNQNGWNPALPEEAQIYVFDTDFIHRNVFTGLTIERKNQENITQFVMGEAGVRNAKDIEDAKIELRKLKKDSRDLSKNIFDGINDISAFLKLQVTGTKEELKRKITNKETDLKTKKDLEENLEKAKDRSEPGLLSVPNKIDAFVEQVNTCLKSSFQKVHDDATDAVKIHIENKTKNIATTKAWLNSGLEQVSVESCPFCGQTLEDEGKKLIELYQGCFDDAFKKFESETKATLRDLPSQLSNFKCSTIPEKVQENRVNIGLYPELAEKKKFIKSTRLINASSFGLKKVWDKFQTQYSNASNDLIGKIDDKKEAIYDECTSLSCSDLKAAYGSLKFSTEKYNVFVQQILDQIDTFKESLDPETIADEILNIERDKAKLELMKKRLESDSACVILIDLLDKTVQKETEIENLKDRLKDEQSQFLDDCFDSINTLFSRFGSGPFEISKQMNDRGNMPVIQLTASFSGIPISQDKLKIFFSESDRRALALSIFWAKIESLSEEQKRNSILVLDDPVTSFDDGRIDRTIRLMETSRPNFRQVIILSHYPRYLKAFFERASQNTTGLQLSQIVKENGSSKLKSASPTDFIETDHQLKLRHIAGFIEHQHNEDVCQDLRIFLETEIKSRFRKQIIDKDLNNLSFKNLLDSLLEFGIIDEPLRSELEEYRLSLNINHHTWADRSLEDKIALSADVLECVYEKL